MDKTTDEKDLAPVVMAMSDQEIMDLRESFNQSPKRVFELSASGKKEFLEECSRFFDLVLIRVAPNMSDEKEERYRRAMVATLEQLPAALLKTALVNLRTAHFRYIQDIEKGIFDEIKRLRAESSFDGREGFMRFLRLKDAREQAKLPKPPVPPPLTIEEIARMSSELRSAGLTLGEITEDQIAAADLYNKNNQTPPKSNGDTPLSENFKRSAMRLAGK